MKKIFSLVLLALVFVMANSLKSLAQSAPSQKKIHGTWTLDNVALTSLADTDVDSLFSSAPPKAFIGSTWEFDADGNGSYTLANGTVQYIKWSVNSGDALGPIIQFKKINKGQSPDEVRMGYQLTVSGKVDQKMTLK